MNTIIYSHFDGAGRLHNDYLIGFFGDTSNIDRYAPRYTPFRDYAPSFDAEETAIMLGLFNCGRHGGQLTVVAR